MALATTQKRVAWESKVSDWSVECEAPGPRRHDEALADELIERLDGYGAAVAVGRGSIVVRFDVKAVSARHAFETPVSNSGVAM